MIHFKLHLHGALFCMLFYSEPLSNLIWTDGIISSLQMKNLELRQCMHLTDWIPCVCLNRKVWSRGWKHSIFQERSCSSSFLQRLPQHLRNSFWYHLRDHTVLVRARSITPHLQLPGAYGTEGHRASLRLKPVGQVVMMHLWARMLSKQTEKR